MKYILLRKQVIPVIIFLFIYSSAYGVDLGKQQTNSNSGAMPAKMVIQNSKSDSGDMATEMRGQQGGNHADTMTTEQQKDIFLEKKDIDNYTVSFHVMRVAPGMEHGGSHNFMVKVEQDDKALEDVLINSKVIRPDGKSESKRLVKMGVWYMNGYSLGENGKYQLIILFKTLDGKKHTGGVYYQEKVAQ